MGMVNDPHKVLGVAPGPAELKLGVSSMNIVDEQSIMLTGQPVKLQGKRTYTCQVE